MGFITSLKGKFIEVMDTLIGWTDYSVNAGALYSINTHYYYLSEIIRNN